jgi:hypothetical protein
MNRDPKNCTNRKFHLFADKMTITRDQVPCTPAAQLRANIQLAVVRATWQSLRRFVAPSPLLEEVWSGGAHAAPVADLVRRCGQGLIPCRRRGLCGGLLRGPTVGGGSVFQRSCGGTEPPTLCLSATNFFIHYCMNIVNISFIT